MTALIALLVLSQSPNADAEVFVDRGETYIRAGTNNGLQVGSGLEVLDAKGRTVVGGAVVMEVWEALARINIDSKAAAHPSLKVVRVSRAPEPLVVAPMPLPPPIQQPPSQPQAQPAPQVRPGQPNPLTGYASLSGTGELRRVIIFNSSNRDWHDCDLRLANNRHYRIGDLDHGDQDGVMLFRFEYDGSPPWPAFNGITVVCREGVGRFPIQL